MVSMVKKGRMNNTECKRCKELRKQLDENVELMKKAKTLMRDISKFLRKRYKLKEGY